LDVEPFSQIYARYSPTSKTAEVFINRKRIKHNGDPGLAWAIGNVVMVTDTNANIKPNKKKATNQQDKSCGYFPDIL